MNYFRAALVSFLLALTFVPVFGCAGKDVDESDPAALFKEAEDDIKNDYFQTATDKLRSIRNKFPYSNYAVEAQLKLADIHFIQEAYAEAAATYETFCDLHPKHEKVAYALFRTAKSYFKDTPENIARDMTSAGKALETYQEFQKRFPQAPESAEARADIQVLRDRLANKELYVGNFYLVRERRESARNRFKKLISQYPDTQAAQEAKEKLVQIEKQP